MRSTFLTYSILPLIAASLVPFVASAAENYVQQWANYDFHYSTSISNSSQASKASVYGLTVDSHGNSYVAGGSGVIKYDPLGNTAWTIPVSLNASGDQALDVGLVLDESNNTVYILQFYLPTSSTVVSIRYVGVRLDTGVINHTQAILDSNYATTPSNSPTLLSARCTRVIPDGRPGVSNFYFASSCDDGIWTAGFYYGTVTSGGISSFVKHPNIGRVYSSVTDVAIDNQGYLYGLYSYSGGGIVDIYDPAGNWVSALNIPSSYGLFSAVKVDSQRNIVIAARFNLSESTSDYDGRHGVRITKYSNPLLGTPSVQWSSDYVIPAPTPPDSIHVDPGSEAFQLSVDRDNAVYVAVMVHRAHYPVTGSYFWERYQAAAKFGNNGDFKWAGFSPLWYWSGQTSRMPNIIAFSNGDSIYTASTFVHESRVDGTSGGDYFTTKYIRANCDESLSGTNQFVGCLYIGKTATGSAFTVPTDRFNGLTTTALTTPVPTAATSTDFTFGTSGPLEEVVGKSNYSIRWKGRFTFAAGNYTFTGGSNDGMRVTIKKASDGSLVAATDDTKEFIDRTFSDHALVFSGKSQPMALTAGDYDITLEYYQNNTDAQIKFGWNAPSAACGPSNGAPLASAPTTELCTSGTPSSVSGSGPWTWSCTGTGGTSVSCSANTTTLPDLIVREQVSIVKNYNYADSLHFDLNDYVYNIGAVATPESGFTNLYEINKDTVPVSFADIDYKLEVPTSAALPPNNGSSPPVMKNGYAFASAGTWQLRLCANMNSVMASSTRFTEAIYGSDSNNCGPWTVLHICNPGSAWDDSSNSCVVTTCTNGANNPPTCNTCPAAKTLVGGVCVGVDPLCSNGATNPPACTLCTAPLTLIGGVCTNPPSGSSANVDIKADPNRVKQGNTTTVSWSATNIKSCAIAREDKDGAKSWKSNLAPNASGDIPWSSTNSAVDTINSHTTYTISCTTNTGVTPPEPKSAIVNLLPSFQEF